MWRDADGDGLYDVVEQVPAEFPGVAFQLHWMGRYGNNEINDYSAGCQGIKGNYYIDAKGELKYFLDSEYKLPAEVHGHGSWALFMKMVAGKVFSWTVEDVNGELKRDQPFVHYHLFDEDRDNINKRIIDRAAYVNRMIEAN